MSSYTELLEQVGLTKAEIKVYLALLELGSSTTGPIVEKSKVSSSKIYEILEKLMQKGLASFVIKSGTKHFEAAPPSRILDYMKEKEAQLQKQTKELEKALPELELKQNLSKEKSDVTVFKGMKGLQTAYNDFFKVMHKGDCNYVFLVGEVDDKLNNFFKEHYKSRVNKGITTKTIFSEAGRRHYESRKGIKNYQAKIVGQSSSPATVNIYGNKVSLRIGNSDEVITVVIDNEKLARSFKEQFNTLWNQKVNTYEGFDNVMNKFKSMLNEMKAGEEYQVLGGTYGTQGKKLMDWFLDYHKERIKKGIKARLLTTPDTYKDTHNELTTTGDPEMKLGALRLLSKNFINPMQINLYPNGKVLFFMFGKEMTCFEIESDLIHQNFKVYFESLWEQEIKISKGFDEFENVIKEIHKQNEEYLVLGAGVAQNKYHKEYEAFFDKISKHRIATKTNAKLLFEQNSKKIIDTFPTNYNQFAQTKFLPYKEESPVEVFIEKDKAHISLQEKEPTVITINNQKIANSFRKQFESLWEQDVRVYTGFDATTELFDKMLNSLKPKEAYYALGLSINGPEEGYKEEWFYNFHKRRVKKGVKAMMLCDSNHLAEMKKRTNSAGDTNRRLTQLKSLSPELASPIQINLFGDDNVHIFTWDKEFRCFEIKSKELHDNFKKHFDVLWNQDTIIVKGMDNLIRILKEFIDEIEPGDTFNALGTAFGIKGKEEQYAKAFAEFHKYRLQKNISAKWIFQQGTEKIIAKNKENYKQGKIKFLPYKTESPVAIHPYKNKTLLVIQEEEPTVIIINNAKVTSMFQKQFESLWNQETRVVKGIDAIQSLFEEMLEAGHCDFIGARGYFMDHKKEYIKENWIPKAKKKKFTMRNIVDVSASGHLITTLPFAKTKFGISKEFSDMSVTWIYGNKVVISNWNDSEPIATIIENKKVHEMYKKQFESLWQQTTFSFQGEDGVKAVFDEALECKEVFAIGGNDGIKKYFPEYWKKWDTQRVKNKVMFHDLIDSKLLDKLYDRDKKVPHYEFKILPPELNSPHVIWIYGDKIANIIWDKETKVTIIDDKEIAQSYKNYFWFLWKKVK